MIEVRDLSITLGEFQLRGINLRLDSGQYGVILGPTGAGKTVLVECIVGLFRPAAGQVLLDGRDVTAWPPEQREVAYVPQDYCLFPHLTVAQNICFGLRLRRAPAAAITERLAELAELLHLTALLDRPPLNLSGGEKQRVALARALAIRPRLLLLDEPLAAVDERTRDRLAVELKGLQRHFGATIIHVTHNFQEALAVADRIAIFCDGEIRQDGSPEEVFHRPSSTFVAEFVGSRNLVGGEVHAGLFRAGELTLPVTTAITGPATLVIRPEELQLAATGPAALPGRITRVLRAEHHVRVQVEAAGQRWDVHCPPPQARALAVEGQAVGLVVPAERCHLIAGVDDRRPA